MSPAIITQAQCEGSYDGGGCRLAPEGQKAVEGQKSQPLGAKASEGKPEGKPAIGPKRGTAVSACALPRCSSQSRSALSAAHAWLLC